MRAIFATVFRALFLLPLAPSAQAAATDPAAGQVEALTAALDKAMSAGPALSMVERYRNLEPVVERVFALPLMTRIAVGPEWTKFSPDEQKAVVAAFTRYTVANYARNFRASDGTKFEIDDSVASRGQDKIVRVRLILPHDAPVSLLYRLHEVEGAWKVVDVYANGVSELNLRRTDFAAALGSGGVPELIAHLNKLSDELMKP
ncbi:MAG: ABC transporter substrate-binding protein [Gammaproteobacteria bacterium]|nr:ABC transporter substrate-binding protein [Gammaproteobacteria bacterium]